MKYRHACHAGNFADVLKHVALAAALTRLASKERPLFLLDTHAGRGRYDLRSRDTAAEAAGGILRIAAQTGTDAPEPVARYLEIVRSFNGPDVPPHCYPGSPLLAASLMRSQDRAAFCELQPAEAERLRAEFRGDARIGVHCRDGFEAIRALLPPREQRGLVLLDPPYEEAADFGRVAQALMEASARWPQGSLAAWYPIKQGEISARFLRGLAQSGLRRVLVAELCIHPDDSRAGLNGSGLALVNPPYRLDADLREALPWLHRALSPQGAGRARVEHIAGE